MLNNKDGSRRWKTKYLNLSEPRFTGKFPGSSSHHTTRTINVFEICNKQKKLGSRGRDISAISTQTYIEFHRFAKCCLFVLSPSDIQARKATLGLVWCRLPRSERDKAVETGA